MMRAWRESVLAIESRRKMTYLRTAPTGALHHIGSVGQAAELVKDSLHSWKALLVCGHLWGHQCDRLFANIIRDAVDLVDDGLDDGPPPHDAEKLRLRDISERLSGLEVLGPQCRQTLITLFYGTVSAKVPQMNKSTYLRHPGQ
jgi:hypothetical protein